MLDKIKRLRADHLYIQHGVTLYPYQEVVSDRILQALIDNLRITAEATEEDIKKLKLNEIPIEFSRQSGKTTAVVYTVEFAMTFLSAYFDRKIEIGIFAPQIEQAKTDFDRLKVALRRVKNMIVVDEKTEKEIKEQENSKTLVLPDGSSCYIAPITKTSKPESKTLDLIIIEESQDVDDKILKESIWPIGASTNAPRVYIGTAGTKLCYFRKLGQSTEAIKLYYHDIVEQRRETYKLTNDATHLIYEQTVKQEIEKHGLESDEIQRPYFGKWLIGTGQFTTQDDLEKLETDRKLTYQEKSSESYAGIDTAKNPDSTVVTVIRHKNGKKELINWLELKGDNYQDQFDIINEFLSNYKVIAIAIDATGQGDFMPDMFEAHTEYQDEDTGLYRVKFSAVSKDMMYKNLKVSIKELLTTLPDLSTKQGEKFRQQMLDLQQEYKGQLLSVHHPDDPNAHDDYCFLAGTQILTDKGNRNIEDISVGDMVMTRKGYRSVVKTGDRLSEVINRLGLTGTPDHPFITTRGVKRFDSLTVSDILHVWNEKQSSIEERSITEIQTLNADSIGSIIGATTNGRSHQYLFIDRFIRIIMGTYQRVMSYTTKIITHLTTAPITSPVLLGVTTKNITWRATRLKERHVNLWRNMQDPRRKSGIARQKESSGIENTPTNLSSNIKPTRVLYNKTKNSLSRVYNIEIEDAHEYFANNILVHNCDSWALAEWAYAKWNQSERVQLQSVKLEPERKVKRDDKGNVTDHWPGEDF